MAYFNHAFHKCFVATKADQTESSPGTAAGLAGVENGILTTAGMHVSNLKSTAPSEGWQLGPGVTGIFGAKGAVKDLSLDPTATVDCCPFYLAASAIKLNDKQGSFHGGYQASNKSKVVNPKYIRKGWVQTANAAQNAFMQIGGTPDNIADNPSCNKEFLCEETYYLRLEVKGTDALRFANHNLYQTLGAYTGCCDDPLVPTAVDPKIVYLDWAQQIAGIPGSTQASDEGSAYFKDFIRPIVVVDGISYAQNETIANEEGLPAGSTWADIPAGVATEAGLILLGAYVETKFGDCTFCPTDYYSVEPLQLFASEVDLNGDPCTFEGLCVVNTCLGIQANGLGESVQEM